MVTVTNKKQPTNTERIDRDPASLFGAGVPPAVDNQQIYDMIFRAIAERRLPPGIKLSEERLGRVFGVSRTRLREVFFRLAQDRILTLEPNRGAFVAKPSVRETREVFAARRAIEVAVVAQLAKEGNAPALARLRQHLALEAQARQQCDRAELTRLTGDFHVLLAELTENSHFHEIMRRLVALSSLIISLYDSPGATACQDHEHATIVDAIASHDTDTATVRLLAHLDHVEHSLIVGEASHDAFDIEAVFAGMLAKV